MTFFKDHFRLFVLTTLGLSSVFIGWTFCRTFVKTWLQISVYIRENQEGQRYLSIAVTDGRAASVGLWYRPNVLCAGLERYDAVDDRHQEQVVDGCGVRCSHSDQPRCRLEARRLTGQHGATLGRTVQPTWGHWRLAQSGCKSERGEPARWHGVCDCGEVQQSGRTAAAYRCRLWSHDHRWTDGNCRVVGCSQGKLSAYNMAMMAWFGR